MSETVSQEASLKQLLDRMVAAKQLSATDAGLLAQQGQSGAQTPPKGRRMCSGGWRGNTV